MAYDGSIRISTEIDTKDLIKQLSDIKSTVDKTLKLVEGSVADSARDCVTRASTAFKEVGVMMGQGMINGVNSKSGALSAATASIVRTAVDSAKKAAGIHSPSAVMRDEVGKMMSLGMAEGIKDNAIAVTAELDALIKKSVEAFDEQERLDINKQEFDKKMGALSDEDYMSRMENRIVRYREYSTYVMTLSEYTEEEKLKLQRKYLDKAMATELELFEFQKQIIEQKKDEITDAYTEIAKSAELNMTKVQKATESLEKKLKNYGSLFERRTVTIVDGGRGMYFENGSWKNEKDLVVEEFNLSDIKGDIATLNAYSDALYAVKERGNLPKDFFSVLRDLSVEDGIDFANALLSLSDEDFASYMADWQQKQESSESISKLLFEDEESYAQSIIDEVDNIKDKVYQMLTDAGLDIPEGFLEIGKSSAEEFGVGFAQKIDEIFADVNAYISLEVGKYIPQFTATGESGGASTVNTITNEYNIGTTKNTISEQLRAIESANEVQRLRNGEG